MLERECGLSLVVIEILLFMSKCHCYFLVDKLLGTDVAAAVLSSWN
jgi:hypothetical protein